jgi:hypothetical protein
MVDELKLPVSYLEEAEADTVGALSMVFFKGGLYRLRESLILSQPLGSCRFLLPVFWPLLPAIRSNLTMVDGTLILSLDYFESAIFCWTS